LQDIDQLRPSIYRALVKTLKRPQLSVSTKWNLVVRHHVALLTKQVLEWPEETDLSTGQ
jgi:hypothetical protein